MPRLIELLLHPERRRPDPEPARIDFRRLFVLTVPVWLVALAIEGVRWATGTADGRRGFAVCAVGLALNLYGFSWARRHPEASSSSDG